MKPNDYVKFANPEKGEENHIMRVVESMPARPEIGDTRPARVKIQDVKPLTRGAFVELFPVGTYLESDLMVMPTLSQARGMLTIHTKAYKALAHAGRTHKQAKWRKHCTENAKQARLHMIKTYLYIRTIR